MTPTRDHPAPSQGVTGEPSGGRASGEVVGERVPAGGDTGPDGSTGRRPRADKKRAGALQVLRELPVLLLVAFVLALLIKTFLVQAFYIPSESMEPTLNIGDRVLVNKVVYHLHPPRRGDIIVFSDPHPTPGEHASWLVSFGRWITEGLGVRTSSDKDFIKRVIGLPGDLVEIKAGVVLIDGRALHEPYLPPDARLVRDYGPVRVPPDSLFVMGDNRLNSNDSRFELGFIPYGKVIGRAFVTVWPPSRVRWLHGL